MYIKDTCLRPPFPSPHMASALFHIPHGFELFCLLWLCPFQPYPLPSWDIFAAISEYWTLFSISDWRDFPSDPDLLPFVGMVLSIPLTWASPWRPHFTQTDKEMAPLTYCAEPSDLNFSNRNVLRMVSQAFRIQGPTFLSERTPRVTCSVSMEVLIHKPVTINPLEINLFIQSIPSAYVFPNTYIRRMLSENKLGNKGFCRYFPGHNLR